MNSVTPFGVIYMTHLSMCVLLCVKFTHNVMLLTAALGESFRYTHRASVLGRSRRWFIPLYIIASFYLYFLKTIGRLFVKLLLDAPNNIVSNAPTTDPSVVVVLRSPVK